MKQLAIILLLLTGWSLAAGAQNVVIGERIPPMQIARWETQFPPEIKGNFVLLDFFHSASPECVAQIENLARWADRFADRLLVVVVTREDDTRLLGDLLADKPLLKIAVDDQNKTFVAYGVQYVPFSVLADGRGRALWLGNLSTLDAETLAGMLK